MHLSTSHHNSHEVALKYFGCVSMCALQKILTFSLSESCENWGNKELPFMLKEKKGVRMFSLHKPAFCELDVQCEFDICLKIFQLHNVKESLSSSHSSQLRREVLLQTYLSFYRLLKLKQLSEHLFRQIDQLDIPPAVRSVCNFLRALCK